MGIFKQMKDMKDMVSAAPGLIDQAQQMSAQAQQMAAAQRAAAQAQMGQYGAQPGGFGQQSGFGQPGAFGQQAPAGPDFEPIDGVTLEQFAAVGKAVAAYNYDGNRLPEIAASHGIPADAWATASQGWNNRMMANPAVAQRYNQLYRAS
jgi:hypothetical protein